jgi:hypothetical protein
MTREAKAVKSPNFFPNGEVYRQGLSRLCAFPIGEKIDVMTPSFFPVVFVFSGNKLYFPFFTGIYFFVTGIFNQWWH